MKNKVFWGSLPLIFGMISTTPAVALSATGLQKQQRSENSHISENTAGQDTQATSLHHFLPGLIGPRLYLYLLQSDQFITAQGLIDSYWDQYMIKKTP